MCGRYAYLPTADPTELIEQFSIHGDPPDVTPRYNVAPTDPVTVVHTNRELQQTAAVFRWGLIPSWSKPEAARRSGHINARAETLAEKPAFRRLLLKRRCLVLASGFYEWQHGSSRRERMPYYFSPATDNPLTAGGYAGTGVVAFAGLYDRWYPPDGDRIDSCTIITTSPNGLVAPLHDRMPVMLAPDAIELWLDREMADPMLLTSVLAPAAEGALTTRRVSQAVNSVANDGPGCQAPAEEWNQGGLDLGP